MSRPLGNTAVLLTPPGPAAIAVIRLTGPLNPAFAAAYLKRSPRVGRCVHCDLYDNGTVIDDVVVVETPDGALDLNAHGGPWVVEATLQLARRFGYAIKAWNDAAETAFDAADDIEQQMQLDLPAARSLAVIRLLTAQPAAWRAMMASPDASTLQRAIDDKALARALSTPTVAIVGPPNVGKSTLANALFGRERSITADRPGTTRDWVGELADVDGLVVCLIDTPGVRVTTDAIEAVAINRAAPVVAAADLVVVAVDGSVPLDAAAADLVDAFPTALLVLTMADRPATADDAAANGLRVSGLRGDGLKDFRRAIRDRLGCLDLTSPHARCWTDAQRYTLRRRLDALPASI